MRKLAFAGALVAAALFARGVQADDAAEKAKSTGAPGTAEVQPSRGPEARSPMSDDAHAKSAHAKAEKKHTLFEGKNNFDVDGKIMSVSADKITISRDDLPPATLHVSKGTKVELDGDQVSVGQLRQGEDVKASFNLNKDKPEAVEIKAKRTK